MAASALVSALGRLAPRAAGCSSRCGAAVVALRRGSRGVAAGAHALGAGGADESRAAELHVLDDSDLANLGSSKDPPMVLHWGVGWSKRSQEVREHLSTWWSKAGGRSSGVVCATASMEDTPAFTRKERISGVPTVMLLRGGKVESRADGATVDALERILREASLYCVEPDAPVQVQRSAPSDYLAGADELLRVDGSAEEAAKLYQGALELCAEAPKGEGASQVFRARLGLLRCAMLQATAAKPKPPRLVGEAAAALANLQVHHEEDLLRPGDDALEVAMDIAHAELMIDYWVLPRQRRRRGRVLEQVLAQRACGGFLRRFLRRQQAVSHWVLPRQRRRRGRVLEDAANEEPMAQVLSHYANGQPREALRKALEWYKREVGANVAGLVEAYVSPERLLVDRGDAPAHSLYAKKPYVKLSQNEPGFSAPRALLRRLVMALGPESDEVHEAMAELGTLLDRKEWVRFHTRFIVGQYGGAPRLGRGTGKRTGFSKAYWLHWDARRIRVNNRKMGSPHCDAGD